jgi:hypothetical protein
MITTETINRIVGFRGDGLPVVSLYARVPTDLSSRGATVRSEVDSQLHEIRPRSEDHALGHHAMMSIRGDRDRIAEIAAEQRWSPGGVALFSCSGRGFFEEVQLPRHCCVGRLRGGQAGLMRRHPARVPVPRSGFAGFRFPSDVIMVAVRWYLRYGLSYRDVEELLAERGITVDHVTVSRWVQRFTPLLIDAARPCRHVPGDRWFGDET